MGSAALSSDRLNLRSAFEIVQALTEELIGLNKFDREQFNRAKLTGISCVCVYVLTAGIYFLTLKIIVYVCMYVCTYVCIYVCM